MTVWVLGKWAGFPEHPWELLGVFDDEEVAESYCVTPEHFIGPLEMNHKLPEELTVWSGLRYPMWTGVDVCSTDATS